MRVCVCVWLCVFVCVVCVCAHAYVFSPEGIVFPRRISCCPKDFVFLFVWFACFTGTRKMKAFWLIAQARDIAPRLG